MRLLSMLLLLGLGFESSAQMKFSNFRQFDSTLQFLHQTSRFNGVVLYAENGKIVYQKTLGLSAPDSSAHPLQLQDAFNLASVSKQFVSYSVLLLAHQQKVLLNDPVQKYLAEFPYPNITVRHLLTQTSGLPEYFDLFTRYRMPLDTLDNSALLQLLKDHPEPLHFFPGSSWEYCNTNYALLVSLIEQISQQHFEDFFQKHIAQPAGMQHSFVWTISHNRINRDRVIGFENRNDSLITNDLTVLDNVVGDGNIYASAADLLKWDQFLLQTGRNINPMADSSMHPARLNNGSSTFYGMGWVPLRSDSLQLFHTGGWTGFRSLFWRDLRHQRTLIILSSGTQEYAIRLGQQFMLSKPLDTIPVTTLIQHIRLADGTGHKLRLASVRISGNQIIGVGTLKPFLHETIIDGKGMILAPGFIDTHSHLAGSLDRFPEALAALNQGVTTIVAGQDGDSDPADSLKLWLKQRPAAINVATYTGHTSLRERIMGTTNLSRPATPDEIAKMKELLQADLQKGSLGLSTGLEYEGAFYSNRHEVIELAKATAQSGGRYISHIRSEDIQMKDAVEEIIEIGREAQIPVQISHIKIALKDDWYSAPDLIARLQSARSEGINITADCYPYEFWNSTIRVLFPRKDFHSLAGAQYACDHLFDPEGSVMVRFAPNTEYKGKTVAAIARIRKETPAQTLLYLVAAAEQYEKEHPGAGGIETIMGKSMVDSDIASLLSWPYTNLCSDGANGGHPRGYGSFTRVLHHFVKETHTLSWEEAIFKMTGLAAAQTGIRNRGLIAPGYYADLVLINPDTVKDQATVENPKALSDGIERVWVNGVLVYQNKKTTGNFPGQFVQRNQ